MSPLWIRHCHLSLRLLFCLFFMWWLKTGFTVLSFLQDTDEVDAPVKKREREDVKVPDSKLDKRLQVTISFLSINPPFIMNVVYFVICCCT